MKLDLYPKGFAIVVVALFAVALYWMLSPLWSALAWSICFAFLLTPLHRKLTRKLKGRANVSAGAITLLLPVMLAGPVASLGVAFTSQAGDMVTRLQKLSLGFDAGLFTQLQHHPVIGRLAEWLRHNLTTTTEQLDAWLVSGVQMLLQSLAATGGNFVLGALGTIIHFFMMLFMLFFFLRDGAKILDRAVRLVPMEPQRRREMLSLIGDTMRAVIYGEIMTAIAQGTLVAIGFAIAGLPSAIVFGVLAAALALVPVGGAALVWMPAVFFLAATSQWEWAIFMLIWGTGVSISDNLMRPMLISSQSQAPVSTLVIFVGVIGGISAFGMIGVIIGPVVLTVITTLLHFLDESLPHPS
ncbi:MAG TPA: AI-2E family transporter [Thiobacillus sp.]|nr:AI-2E family transporter [Thiobacillus sp.]HQT70547.1 AI-2E family transporter [Thiobacillus sp.]